MSPRPLGGSLTTSVRERKTRRTMTMTNRGGAPRSPLYVRHAAVIGEESGNQSCPSVALRR